MSRVPGRRMQIKGGICTLRILNRIAFDGVLSRIGKAFGAQNFGLAAPLHMGVRKSCQGV